MKNVDSIATALNMGEVQVRKDLAMVSDGGRPKIGYLRERLMEDISQFLGYDNTTDAVLIGAGRLGQALMGYRGFEEYGLNVLAAFDTNPAVDRTDDGKPIYRMDQLETFCKAHKVLMGIITVPVEHAQQVCDRLIHCGIKAIWNFAHVDLNMPEGIQVENVHLSESLMKLSYNLNQQD